MAISTINPWSAGAVVFNQQPWMAFYERQAAKKQAKEDALDTHFRDLSKNVTSAGVRSQDLPGFLQRNKDWQQNYLQNKAAILNPKLDNGKAYSDYHSGYQDQLSYIDRSKNRSKTTAELGKLTFKPEMSHIKDDPNYMEQLDKHALPLDDPNGQEFDIASAVVPPKPKGTKEWEEHNKYLTGGIPFDKIPGIPENMGGFKTRTPIHQQYSPDSQVAIGQHAANEYDTDKGWRLEANKYLKELQHDPIEFQKANTVYKNLYGADIDEPKDAWIAKGILDNNLKATEYKEGKDDLGMAVYMENLRTANDLKLAREKKKIGDDPELNNAWLEGHWRNRIIAAKQGKPVGFPDPQSGLGIKIGWEIKPDKVILDALSRDGKQPNRIYITDKNEIYPVFHQFSGEYDKKGHKVRESVDTDANSQPIIDKEKSQPMDLEQALISTGYKTSSKGKQLNQTMTSIIGPGQQAPEAKAESGPHPLPKGKPRTVKQGGHIYTWSEQNGKYE